LLAVIQQDTKKPIYLCMKIVYKGETQRRGEGCDVSHPRAQYVYKLSVIEGERGFFQTASSWADSLLLGPAKGT
jgi:hypothetical protein